MLDLLVCLWAAGGHRWASASGRIVLSSRPLLYAAGALVRGRIGACLRAEDPADDARRWRPLDVLSPMSAHKVSVGGWEGEGRPHRRRWCVTFRRAGVSGAGNGAHRAFDGAVMALPISCAPPEYNFGSG